MATTEAKDLFPRVEARCQELWPGFFFTPLIMVDWLRQKSQRSWEDFVKTPSFKKDSTKIKLAINEADEDELRPLWAAHTGVCTSWAVAVAQTFAGDVEFKYGENRSHRAAWVSNGVVVDSSARNALRLEECAPTSQNGTTWEMRNIGSQDSILYSGKTGEGRSPFRVLQGSQEAMKCCLRQLLNKKGGQIFYSLYRMVRDDQLRFNGALYCQLSPEECVIGMSYSSLIPGAQTRVSIVAKFGATVSVPQGADQKELERTFWDFHQTPERVEQFDRVRPVLMQLWTACKNCYGNPVYERTSS